MTPQRAREIFAEEMEKFSEHRFADLVRSGAAERVRGGADVDPTIRAALRAMSRVAKEAARHDLQGDVEARKALDPLRYFQENR